MKYVSYVRQRFQKVPAFTIAELKTALGTRGASDQYIKLLVHKLLASRDLKRITRGVYTFQDEVEVVGFAFQPFYYGLQEALSLRNLWEQETNPVVITPRKVRTGVRSFEGRNYVVRHVDRKFFFGYETVKYGDFWIPVSDIEKTLLDFLYFEDHIQPAVKRRLAALANRKKLRAYLYKSPAWLQKKVRTRA